MLMVVWAVAVEAFAVLHRKFPVLLCQPRRLSPSSPSKHKKQANLKGSDSVKLNTAFFVCGVSKNGCLSSHFQGCLMPPDEQPIQVHRCPAHTSSFSFLFMACAAIFRLCCSRRLGSFCPGKPGQVEAGLRCLLSGILLYNFYLFSYFYRFNTLG